MAPPSRPSADERAYRPRPATERVLRELAAWLEGPVSTAVVEAAPGAGVTYLLRRFERRARARRHVLYSPFLHIEAAALEPWLAGLARNSSAGSLEAWLAGDAGAPPLLLVDEAHIAMRETLEALARLREMRAPELRICLGGCAGRALEQAARGVGGPDVRRLELAPWSPSDLRRLADALCAIPGPRERASDPAVLVAACEGSPGLLRDAWSAHRERGLLLLP